MIGTKKNDAKTMVQFINKNILPDVFSVMKGVISAIESSLHCLESITCCMQRASHITHNLMGKQKFQTEKLRQYWKKR